MTTSPRTPSRRRGSGRALANARRDRARAHREDDVLEAAERVFTRHGYHAASMAEIAREAGYAVGSLYKLFDSKDALFLRLLDQRMADFDDLIEGALGSAT